MRSLITRIVTVASLFGIDVWSVWTFVQTLRSSVPMRVVGSIDLHPPFFLLLACVATPVTVAVAAALFWDQARRLLPRNRFHDLAPDIRELPANLAVMEELLPSDHARILEQTLALRYRLERLGIEAPPFRDHDKWLTWRPLMAAWAETKNIRAARKWC